MTFLNPEAARGVNNHTGRRIVHWLGGSMMVLGVALGLDGGYQELHGDSRITEIFMGAGTTIAGLVIAVAPARGVENQAQPPTE
ncbi:MAG TPA: hypothetical protein VMY99_02640 [Nevskiaceae bacterium]|nr:hypothetical protein [Nevskiaceae bacterium]